MIPHTKSKAEIKKLMGVQPIKYPTVTSLQLEHRRQAKLFMEKCDTCNPKLYYESEQDYKIHLNSHGHKHVLSITYNRTCEHPDCLAETWKKLAISKGYSNYAQPEKPAGNQIKKPVENAAIPPKLVTISRHVGVDGQVTYRRHEQKPAVVPPVKKTQIDWAAHRKAAVVVAEKPIAVPPMKKTQIDWAAHRRENPHNRHKVVYKPQPTFSKEFAKQNGFEIDEFGHKKKTQIDWAAHRRENRHKVVYKPQPTFSKEFAKQNGFEINELGYKLDKYGNQNHESTVIRKGNIEHQNSYNQKMQHLKHRNELNPMIGQQIKQLSTQQTKTAAPLKVDQQVVQKFQTDHYVQGSSRCGAHTPQ